MESPSSLKASEYWASSRWGGMNRDFSVAEFKCVVQKKRFIMIPKPIS